MFILRPFSYNIQYLFWYTTSYNCTSFMMLIWSYIYYVTRARVSPLQPMIRSKIPLQLLHRKVEPTYKERFLTFSPTTHEDKWILLSLKKKLNLGGRCHCQSDSSKFGAMHFNNDSACSNNCC
jgi:hypothetical protein